MKKLLFVAAAFILSAGVMAQKTMVNDYAKFSIDKHNFGKIKQNVPVNYTFEIKNISGKPIVIENAHSTCGCTVPEFPKEPILPGKSAKIKVQYNATAGGHFDKPVYIKLAGVDEEKQLGITGEVLQAEAYDAWVKQNAGKKQKTKSTKSGK